MGLVRILTRLERVLTNVIAAVLRTSMRVLTRLLGRGRHRAWRKAGQAKQDRRSG